MPNPFTSNDKLKGFATGVGISLITPLILTALTTIARPAARAAIKAGLVLYERGREKIAEANEVFEDLVAEARAELDENRADMNETMTETEESAGSSAEGRDPMGAKPDSPHSEA